MMINNNSKMNHALQIIIFFSSFIMNFSIFLMLSCFHLFLLISLLLFLVKKLKTDTKKEKGLVFPPGPPKLPIIGNLHQLGKLPHSSLRLLSRLYGPVMRLHFGRYETLVISSADAAREILKTHDLNTCSRPSRDSAEKLTYNYIDIAFCPYNDYWKEMRKTCFLELFSTKRVKSYQSIREEETFSMIDSISESVYSEGTPVVDLSEKLLALIASIVFRIAYGKKFQSSDFENYDEFNDIVSETQGVLGSFSASEFIGIPDVVGKMIDRVSGRYARLEKVFKVLDGFFQRVINEHLDPHRIKTEEDDIIDVLLSIKKEQDKRGASSISHENIKGILLDIFLGGIDTSAITLTWAMSELAKQPKVMRKAQQEIRNHIKDKGKVTETETVELPYLKMIVKETLRLHPPAPLLLPRETMSHFQINGYDISPKTLTLVNVWAIGRDPNSWKDPEEFIPDRFIEKSIDYKGQNFEFLPFGGGRRSCPAIFMGMKNVELVLANLLYCFDWKMPNGMKEEDLNMEEATGLSLTVFKKSPLKLVPSIQPSIH